MAREDKQRKKMVYKVNTNLQMYEYTESFSFEEKKITKI